MPNDLLTALDALTILPLLGSGSRRAVGWSTVGALLIILGVASAAPDWATLSTAPDTFLAVSAGFVWLGVTCLAFGGWAASQEEATLALHPAGPVALNLAITAAAVIVSYVLYRAWPLLVGGNWKGLAAAIGLGGMGVVLALGLPLLRGARMFKWIDERWLARTYPPGPCFEERGRRIVWGVTLAAVAALLWSGYLYVGVIAALVAVVAAHRLGREAGRAPALPVQPIVVALSLLTFTWLVVTIAGADIPLHFPDILDAPLSDTAEAMLALILGLGIWSLLGLWPFHGAGPGSALALVGGALLLRWGVGLIPAGIEHAMPIFALVAGFATLHAASTGRVGEYTAALGVLAVAGGEKGTWALFALASLVALMRLSEYHPPIPGLDRRQLAGVALIPALAAVLPGALRGETFLTVVAVLAGVSLFRPAQD
jgi:hypothetical protein